jgi:peptidoglycan/xylan/chitin deacetylase (PgdA/CDA1 family)
LHDMGIKAIFFVVSGFVDLNGIDDCHAFIAKGIRTDINPSLMPTHWNNMNWEDLEYLLDAGHTIGAHTATHARLSELNDDVELEKEIISSADLLDAKLGINVEHFAFTFGNFASLSCDALNVAKRRFKYIYTSLRGGNEHNNIPPLLIYRDTITPQDDNYLTGAFLAGGADLAYRNAKKAINSCV